MSSLIIMITDCLNLCSTQEENSPGDLQSKVQSCDGFTSPQNSFFLITSPRSDAFYKPNVKITSLH